jgi:hypothetical protein
MRDIQQIMARAERTNLDRDRDERMWGFASPGDCDDALLMRTAVDALQAGLVRRDWDCVAEAADMLAKRANYHPWKTSNKGGRHG